MKILVSHIIILLFSVVVFGQPTEEGKLFINITDKSKIIEISSEYEPLLSRKAKNKTSIPIIIKSIDKKYTFIFDYPTIRGDYYSSEGFPNYIYENNLGSCFMQQGWIVNSKSIVVNEKSNDTMTINIKNVFDKSIILDVKFTKGNFIYDLQSSIVNNPEIITELSFEELKQKWKEYSGNPFYQSVHRKIYLKKVKSKNKSLDFEYELLYPRDSIYIDFKYSGDFGIENSTYFVLKDNLPDGEYEIYVEDKLRKISFFKNGLKNNQWIEYLENNEKQITEYSNGKIKTVFEYFPDGSLKSKSCFNSKGIKMRTIYYNSGGIKMKEYFQDNEQYKIKKFDRDGKIIETKKIKRSYDSD